MNRMMVARNIGISNSAWWGSLLNSSVRGTPNKFRLLVECIISHTPPFVKYDLHMLFR